MTYPKHTSLKDLARILGVSVPTVSRALKDSPEISRDLCDRAKQLAKEMNYRPNPFAMSLRKNTPPHHWSHCTRPCYTLFLLHFKRYRKHGCG